MLQQTRVDTAIPFYRRFLRRFPTLKALAASDLEVVLKLWEGLGYYGRARNLHRACRVVQRDHAGRVPRDPDSFRRLPGVGDYIGAAVFSIAFRAPVAAVDGNVKRVLSRLNAIASPVDLPASHTRFKKAAQAILDPEDPGGFNQALMDLGALVCTPRNPACSRCPVRRFCRAVLDGTVARFPRRRPRPSPPTRRVAVGVVFRRGRVLITRRPEQGLLGGLWEFPGGKIEEGESPEDACLRELKEETGITAAVVERLATVRHAYTHFKVVLEVFRCTYRSGRVRLAGAVDHRWVTVAELDDHAFPGANRKFIPLLKRA
jgi:A/G-specific adenine glycosylase